MPSYYTRRFIEQPFLLVQYLSASHLPVITHRVENDLASHTITITVAFMYCTCVGDVCNVLEIHRLFRACARHHRVGGNSRPAAGASGAAEDAGTVPSLQRALPRTGAETARGVRQL